MRQIRAEMAYDPYRNPQQPYDQQQQQPPPPPFNQNGGTTTTTSAEAYGNPPPPMPNNFFQPPYPDHVYDADPQLVTPSSSQQSQPQQPQQPPLYAQPQPQPPPLVAPIAQQHIPQVTPIAPHFPPIPISDQDPARFYQAHTAAIDRAVASAFPQQPTADVSPDLIAQITSTVIQQLRNTNINPGPVPQQQQQQQPKLHPQQPPHPLQHQQAPPPPPPSQSLDMAPFHTPASAQSDYSPPGAQRRVYTPPSPYKPTEDQQYSSPPMGGSQASYNSASQLNHRPSPDPARHPPSPYARLDRPGGLSRRPTSMEETTIEKVWGQLFERDGKPTHRMGQFLRGIAVHLIENYPPGNTLVVTPEKMQKYYEETKVPGDTYPWNDIFDDRTSNISRLYRELQAAHHLVQDRLEEKPDIPGLTPHGFERWMTLLVQAHPEQTFERLQRTVREMPINNPDDRRERFPKELSRRAFPKSPDNAVKELLERGIITHCKIRPSELGARNLTTQGGRSHSRYRSSSGAEPLSLTTSAPSPVPFDHKRIPYSSTVEDGPDNAPLARPLERERQPYAVQPTGGKVYNPNSSRVTSPVPISPQHYRDQDWPRSPSKDPGGTYRDAADDVLTTGPRRGADRGLYGSSPVTKDEPDSRRYRDVEKDRFYDAREPSRERDRRRHHTRPSRGSRDIDEEFYRPSAFGGRVSPDPYEQDDSWAGGRF